MEKKKISVSKMVLFTVSGILVLDTFAAPVVMGVPVLTMWLIVGILHLIPFGLLNSELGTTYPDAGGITSWVKRAFGEFQQTIVGWFYYFNVVLWLPAVAVVFAYWVSYTFLPEISTAGLLFFALLLIVIVVIIGIRGIDLGVTISNIGGFLKTGILLLFGFLGIYYGVQNGFANDFSPSAFVPSFSDSLIYLSVLVYNLMGFELILAIATELDQPEKTVPKMTVISGALVLAVYIFATLGMLSAVPVESVDPVDGFIITLEELFTPFGAAGTVLFKIVAALALLTLITNMVSWTLGSTEALLASGIDKKSPHLFGHKHKKYDTYDRSYLFLGIVAALLVVFNFMLSEDANAVFWTILAFSFVIFLLPYLWMFWAAVKLRKIDPDTPRPFRVPGGEWGIKLVASIATIVFIITIGVLFLPNEDYDPMIYYPTLIIGTIVSYLIGVWIYMAGKKYEKEDNSDSP